MRRVGSPGKGGCVDRSTLGWVDGSTVVVGVAIVAAEGVDCAAVGRGIEPLMIEVWDEFPVQPPRMDPMTKSADNRRREPFIAPGTIRPIRLRRGGFITRVGQDSMETYLSSYRRTTKASMSTRDDRPRGATTTFNVCDPAIDHVFANATAFTRLTRAPRFTVLTRRPST